MNQKFYISLSYNVFFPEVYALDRLKDSTKHPLTPAEYRRLKPLVAIQVFISVVFKFFFVTVLKCIIF